VHLYVTPAPDGEDVVAVVHHACFATSRHREATPDDPRDHGRIPAYARCAFCNERLPLVGQHPVSFDVGSSTPPQRYWAHVRCLTELLRPAIAARITDPHPRHN
jgi:hypothetical protein